MLTLKINNKVIYSQDKLHFQYCIIKTCTLLLYKSKLNFALLKIIAGF